MLRRLYPSLSPTFISLLERAYLFFAPLKARSRLLAHAEKRYSNRVLNVRMAQNGKATEPRKGMPSPRLTETEFQRRFLTQFRDPNFDALTTEIQRIAEAAWDVADDPKGKPTLHIHIVLGGPKAGHLGEGHVRPTLEVIITESRARLRKVKDDETGLALIRPAA
jgi:hypothetical protein